MSSPVIPSTAGISSQTQAHVSSTTTLSSGAIAGIVIGSSFAFAILVCFAIFLVRRRQLRRAGFERVDNPRQLHGLRAYSGDLGHTGVCRAIGDAERFGKHGQQSFGSIEPLLSRGTGQRQQPYPSPRAQSFSSTFRPVGEHLDPALFGDERDVFDPYAEIDGPVIRAEVAGRSNIVVPSAPPTVHWEPFRRSYSSHSRPASGDQTDHGMEIVDRTAADTMSHKPLFINRTLRTHSDVPLSSTRAFDHAMQTRSAVNADSSVPGNHPARSSIQNTQSSRGSGSERKESSVPVELINTQSPTRLETPPKEAISTEATARSPSNRYPPRKRTASPAVLPPVAETPDLSQILDLVDSRPLTDSESRRDSLRERSSSTFVNLSHDTTSRPSSVAIDENQPIPLLASTSFGKGTPTSSLSSNVGWNTNSSSSRYPSIAFSSVGQCSGSIPHSGGYTDWHHPPTGLAGLKDLQMEPLRNPHSPVEGSAPPLPAPSVATSAPGAPDTLERGDTDKRAHLRQGTSSSVPEIRRRSVSQGGIVHIDVAL
ncbi:hypothetical protein F5J12DRAFT_90136 [Pisolithus orientalis]|uniref:uncharacterized protein n=1 Tax=Pisolithus orientalis TaxID=936130 RepID=UPI002224A18F|nr:uncharacterized protein F5J12DRAFT_90136 [Pisolithus orientalis]KAI6007761.1 hypothetical protein F5J12DRAFT_90136 [Pisolithus orientalis]